MNFHVGRTVKTKNAYKILVMKLEGCRYLKNVKGRMTLKCILNNRRKFVEITTVLIRQWRAFNALTNR